MKIEWIDAGGVTTAAGFAAAGTYTGIKTYGPEPRLDLGLLYAEQPCTVAGVFTQSRVCGAPVQLCRERLAGGSARGLIVNSGNSNVATGATGLADARRMAALAAARCGVPEEEFFVASTGVIGRPLPMAKIEAGLAQLQPRREGAGDFARAIMTTDMHSKSRALRVCGAGSDFHIGGAAKGAGMAHPNMATVLCFLTTDAPVGADFLQPCLKRVADASLNMLDVDMDTSTSDSMLILASGAAGGEPIDGSGTRAQAFEAALLELSVALTRDLARDAEGAEHLIVVTVDGARNLDDARRAARTVVSSPLVKTMVTGRDANLGRVLMALGRSGAELQLERISVYLGEHCAFERGAPGSASLEQLSAAMEREEVHIRVDLGQGDASARAWGCDLTEQYVRINADYTT
ncbi:MAG: bifunctional glutamate N-acetyltransferase/amino-acid acetyltransferase ArgJ [Myxococcales bacterium]|nr:bifunctional glutamate N-acetyltransferase/amino-acid acetyltransferase ArgJ [Myxococcales bacterium]